MTFLFSSALMNDDPDLLFVVTNPLYVVMNGHKE